LMLLHSVNLSAFSPQLSTQKDCESRMITVLPASYDSVP